MNYFKLADMRTFLTETDERRLVSDQLLKFALCAKLRWMRTRLRTYIWKSWKTIKNRCRNLRKLGASERNVGIMANTRKGYRRSADSPIVKLAISKDLLKKAGYTFFLDYYLSVKA